MLIVVASTNPVKVAAVRLAGRRLRRRLHQLATAAAVSSTNQRWQVTGISVDSGVAAQPFSEEETRRGAQQRARAALHSQPLAQLAIGLEGGVSEQTDGLYSTVWVTVTDAEGHAATVNGARFLLPPHLAKLIRQGLEMGAAMDQLTGRQDTKHAEGMIGVMTNHLINRTQAYSELVYLALCLYFSNHYLESKL